MRIVRLHATEKKFVVVKNSFDFAPFSQKSFLLQLLEAAKELAPDQQMFLALSEDDTSRINSLLNPLLGGVAIDRGMGRKTTGIDLFLHPFLKENGFGIRYIPADLNTDQPVTEVKEWLLAICTLD